MRLRLTPTAPQQNRQPVSTPFLSGPPPGAHATLRVYQITTRSVRYCIQPDRSARNRAHVHRLQLTARANNTNIPASPSRKDPRGGTSTSHVFRTQYGAASINIRLLLRIDLAPSSLGPPITLLHQLAQDHRARP